MKNSIFILKRYLLLFGFNSHTFISLFRGLPKVLKDYFIIRKQKKGYKDFIFKFHLNFEDRFKTSGSTIGHYFNQDLWVARRIFENKPIKHVDIGSRVDGFVAHVATFMEIEVIDIRPSVSQIGNIKFIQADITLLPDIYYNYCDSISSLHAIEHIGLGRYGDKIDINGHIKALDIIYLMLKKGGKFYFSVPIGKQRIEFNSQRVFNVRNLISLFDNRYAVNKFVYVDDEGILIENTDISNDNIDKNFNCNYGCGIFELTKI
jgi:SAM-dependent methyltransferase